MSSDYALFSMDGKFRYVLERTLLPHVDRRCLFVMLNPSTADAKMDDPTIRRCRRFALDNGFGIMTVVNLFAYRATDPLVLTATSQYFDVIGEDNNKHISAMAEQSNLIIAAWGTRGKFLQRDKEVLALLSQYDIYCVGKNKDGSPKHPLYIKNGIEPEFYMGSLP
jgi:hypothetical protein